MTLSRGRSPLALTLALVGIGCAHVAKTDVTPQGTVELEAAAGGPIANIPTVGPIPIPLTSLGVSVGVAPRWDVSTHLHPTVAAFGIAGVDVGGSFLALTQNVWRPAVLATARLYGFTDFQSGFRPYLELEGTARWRYAKRWATYGTLDGFFQLFQPPIFNLGVGEEVKLGRWAIQLEARWYQPSANTFYPAVQWVGIGSQGAIGVQLGARVQIGGEP